MCCANLNHLSLTLLLLFQSLTLTAYCTYSCPSLTVEELRQKLSFVTSDVTHQLDQVKHTSATPANTPVTATATVATSHLAGTQSSSLLASTLSSSSSSNSPVVVVATDGTTTPTPLSGQSATRLFTHSRSRSSSVDASRDYVPDTATTNVSSRSNLHSVTASSNDNMATANAKPPSFSFKVFCFSLFFPCFLLCLVILIFLFSFKKNLLPIFFSLCCFLSFFFSLFSSLVCSLFYFFLFFV